jgi:hypothetical protein
MFRKVLGCALVAAALVTTTAHADQNGAGGTGGNTGIAVWVADFHNAGTDHGGRGLCEYAGYGHFEAGVNATTSGSLAPSIATNLSVSCRFYGTSLGTLSASASNASVASRSADTPLQRPTLVCLTATISWANGDSWSASKCVDYGAVAVRCCDQLDIAVGLDPGTTGVLGSANDAVIACANASEGCPGGFTETAQEAANLAASGWTPGVSTSVTVGSR